MGSLEVIMILSINAVILKAITELQRWVIIHVFIDAKIIIVFSVYDVGVSYVFILSQPRYT